MDLPGQVESPPLLGAHCQLPDLTEGSRKGGEYIRSTIRGLSLIRVYRV